MQDQFVAGGLSVGITDIDNKIKESEYNALSYFNKICPYCGNGIFDGHIRNKLNLDHFWPIAKGGQNVPWNILPICGRCNRKKKDKLPHEFLEPARFEVCLKYLSEVRNKYCNDSQKCCEIVAKIRSSIIDDRKLTATQAMKMLILILEVNVDFQSRNRFDNDFTSEWITTGAWKSLVRNNEVQKNEVYQTYLNHCESNNLLPDPYVVFGKKFFKLVNCKSSKIPSPETGTRLNCYRLF